MNSVSFMELAGPLDQVDKQNIQELPDDIRGFVVDFLMEDIDKHVCVSCHEPVGFTTVDPETSKIEWITTFIVTDGDAFWKICEDCSGALVPPQWLSGNDGRNA